MEKDNNVNEAQKTLDNYVYTYLVSRNMHTSAEIFAKEANVQPKPDDVLGDGFLSDWWSIFWDVYCSGPGNQASTSTPHQSGASVPPNPDPNHIPKTVPRPLPRNLDLNIPPPHDPVLYNLPQAEASHPMGSSSYRTQRVNNWLQNRRRARTTGLRQILDTSAQLKDTGAPANPP